MRFLIKLIKISFHSTLPPSVPTTLHFPVFSVQAYHLHQWLTFYKLFSLHDTSCFCLLEIHLNWRKTSPPLGRLPTLVSARALPCFHSTILVPASSPMCDYALTCLYFPSERKLLQSKNFAVIICILLVLAEAQPHYKDYKTCAKGLKDSLAKRKPSH